MGRKEQSDAERALNIVRSQGIQVARGLSSDEIHPEWPNAESQFWLRRASEEAIPIPTISLQSPMAPIIRGMSVHEGTIR